MIKSLPLALRLKKAANYRKRSAAATAMKNTDIMDVTPQEVVNQLERFNSQLMIHGHTHRPAIHSLQANGQDAQRIVLGDWYQQGAWLKVTPDKIELLNQAFNDSPEKKRP
jgi:UDP-2,3-diacylglucosamine hydrolase